MLLRLWTCSINAIIQQPPTAALNLLDEGVGVHHVGKVMTLMSEFSIKKISKLTSVHTINRMSDKRARLLYFHMEGKLAEKNNNFAIR